MPSKFYGGLDFGTSGVRISIIDSKKELTYIKNALRIKSEQLKSLKYLIQKEFERNREIQESERQKAEEE